MDITADRVEQIICHKCGASVDTAGAQPFTGVSCPSCSTKLSVPARLGNLLLLKPIGRGAMGVVYRAMDTTLRRTVAVKILKKEEDQEDRERGKACLAEARSLAALNHPNVVHVFSIGMQRNQPYIMMELLDAGRLDRMIKQQGNLEEVDALQIILETTEGLNAALGVGLVHGDVKPANILMNQDGVAKLIDFGIARNIDDDSKGFVGTPYFVAPEIIKGSRLDHRCDIFSLGATLFYALTGKRPFSGKTVKEVLKSRLQGPAQNVRELVPTIHPETADIVARMLEQDPDDRYQSYEEIISDLHVAIETARQGPVDPALADLGAALQDAPGSAETGSTTAESTARTLSRSGSKSVKRKARREPKPPVDNKLLLMIGGAVAGLAILILVIVIIVASGGGGGSSQRGFTDRFESTKLDKSWSERGNGGQLTGEGGYELACDGTSFSSTLRRTIGTGDFECLIRFGNIRWNPDVTAALSIRFDNPGDNSLAIEIEKARTSAPVISVVNRVDGTINKKSDVRLDTDPTALTLKVLWEESTGKYWIFYAEGGGAPNTKHTANPIVTTYKSDKRRTNSISASPIAGEGAFVAQLQEYRFKLLGPNP